ncbi:HtaA domain-containing protein [Citricoccus sp. NR2]|uniref:HtaA domain-containing protein n=1 Tax=Citricoccus sp. NR2 TaxID=3004095 RepID=UPI0022DD823C|nr:HtaA domain-containing protein [Citricoccus sp. NR2]WBL19217.1 HtaA domain-containing protein [Citricoccus sp. NR2]
MKHGLYWPVLERFRSYVESLPDGAVAADARAEVRPTELFFPLADSATLRVGGADSVDATEVGMTVTTLGEVRFGGHGGLLLVPLKDVWVTWTEDRLKVSISYPWHFDGEDPRMDLATGSLTWRRSPTGSEMAGRDLRLTEDGSEMFNGVYPEGEALADLWILLPEDSFLVPNGGG